MTWVFWIACAIVLYVYLGYPLLLALWQRWKPAPARRLVPARPSPPVSIVIAARNEGRRLAARLDDLLALDYPAPVQIVVVSDGSTDESLEVLARYHRHVDCVAAKPAGKAAALNLGVSYARHDILVFADTRQGFAPDALRALVAPFADPRVGVVSGELVLDGEPGDRRSVRCDRRSRKMWGPASACAKASSDTSAGPVSADRRSREDRRFRIPSTMAEGVGLYWRYEKRIRRYESAVGSTLGATGAIYAMRRRLWRPLPMHTILDDVLAPMRVVMAGYRVVFEPRARAFDRPAGDAGAEGRRKRRTLAGNYQLLLLEPALLLPWRNPVWLQFVSHKIGRLIVPYALAAALVSSAALAGGQAIYALAFLAQLLFYGLAVYGWWLERRRDRVSDAAPKASVSARAARVALTFLVMNGSAVAGLGALMTGRKVWR